MIIRSEIEAALNDLSVVIVELDSQRNTLLGALSGLEAVGLLDRKGNDSADRALRRWQARKILEELTK